MGGGDIKLTAMIGAFVQSNRGAAGLSGHGPFAHSWVQGRVFASQDPLGLDPCGSSYATGSPALLLMP
jgi:hypothetical protein